MTSCKKNEILDLLYSYNNLGVEYIDTIHYDIYAGKKSKLPNTISELKMDASHCSLCDLSKSDAPFVFGIGNELSQIYIISMNHHQLKSDLVFNSFKDMIEKVLLLNFNDIYITNILKCTTEQNINKLNKSIELCENYIYKQIEIAKPKIIITLDLAFNFFMKNNENIIDISGNCYDYNGMKLIPLLHPEFVYKNPSFKQKMFEDLKKIKSILEKK
jgi:DNA polymerase